MKKLTAILIICGIILAVFLVNTKSDEGIYRLHIIANSDSEKDQSVKLSVRDAVLGCERELFRGREIKTARQAKSLLMENADLMYKSAMKVLNEQKQSYGVKIATGTYHFPDREYGGEVYPAGEYDALRLVLGDGKGENWWCVMFPPLCIIDDTDAKNADENTDNTVEFKSFFGGIGKWFCDLFNI